MVVVYVDCVFPSLINHPFVVRSCEAASDNYIKLSVTLRDSVKTPPQGERALLRG